VPKEEAEPSGGGVSGVAKKSDLPPAKNATHKVSDASARASSSASSTSTTPPPPQDDAEEA